MARPQERTFLGFSFTSGRRLKRRIAPSAVQRLRRRVRTLTRRSRGVSLKQMVEQLASYLRGWRGYFGFCETSTELRDLDSWRWDKAGRMRDKPRCLLGFFVVPTADGGSRLLVGVFPPFGDFRGGVDGF